MLLGQPALRDVATDRPNRHATPLLVVQAGVFPGNPAPALRGLPPVFATVVVRGTRQPVGSPAPVVSIIRMHEITKGPADPSVGELSKLPRESPGRGQELAVLIMHYRQLETGRPRLNPGRGGTAGRHHRLAKSAFCNHKGHERQSELRCMLARCSHEVAQERGQASEAVLQVAVGSTVLMLPFTEENFPAAELRPSVRG